MPGKNYNEVPNPEYDDPYDDDAAKHRREPLKVQKFYDALKKSLINFYNSPKQKEAINTIINRREREGTNLMGTYISGTDYYKRSYTDEEYKKLLALKGQDKTELGQFLITLMTQKSLLDTVAKLTACIEKVSPVNVPATRKTQDTLNSARRKLVTAMTASEDIIRQMTIKLMKSPSPPVKDMTLLRDTARSLINYYQNPKQPEYLKDLITNTQQIYMKMGSFWKTLKKSLVAVVGISCIIVGSLGLVPSFGASVTLIAAGAALCAYAGIPSFNSYKHVTPESHHASADKLANEMKHIFIQSKKILSLAPKPEDKKEIHHTHRTNQVRPV